MAKRTTARSQARTRAKTKADATAFLLMMERWLTKKFPLRHPHDVQVRSMIIAGSCRLKKGVYQIRICGDMPDYGQGWTLLHEWAHARERGKPRKGEPHHGKRWGREYWPIYSAWFDFD